MPYDDSNFKYINKVCATGGIEIKTLATRVCWDAKFASRLTPLQTHGTDSAPRCVWESVVLPIISERAREFQVYRFLFTRNLRGKERERERGDKKATQSNVM